MEKCPPEVWHEVFALACTDTGLTGRSLSLVSTQIRHFSGPFKYQSIAITRWRQLIAFAQILPQLSDFQKKIKYLFIHCPYPFLDVEDNLRIADEFGYDYPDESDSDYISEGESESNSEFERSLGQDEDQQILEDAQYLQGVREGLLPTEGKTREDESGILDCDIQAVFDKATQALHTILYESSSTLHILGLYWTSFKPLPIQEILPPLPFLDELHLFRCSTVEAAEYGVNSSTTVLFPRLRLCFKSGDQRHQFLDGSITTIAPNLTHFQLVPGLIVNNEHELWTTSEKCATDVISTSLMGSYIGEMPESWQLLWSNRVTGNAVGET